MTEDGVRLLMGKPPLDEIDRDKFPRTAALEDIIRNDTRLRHFRPGDLVVREDDYGNSAFIVLSGKVRVIRRPRLPAKALGRQETRRRGLWQALSQLWTNPPTPERRRIDGDGERRQAAGDGRRREPGRRTGTSAVGLRRTREDEFLMTLLDPAAVVRNHETVEIGPSELFGEIAAVSRSPRTATIFAETASELLEIRWQGLRDIRRRDARFREKVDALYRKHSLEAQFRESPLFARLKEGLLHEVANNTDFASYGEFDWHTTYKALAAKEAVERLEDEPIIVSEDQVADTLFLVRSGFARVSERVDHGHRTVSYLGPGDVFGLAEIVHNWRNQTSVTYQHTLRATGSVDVLRVPAHVVERHVLPGLPDELLPPPLAPRQGSRSAWRRDDLGKKIESGMLEFRDGHRRRPLHPLRRVRQGLRRDPQQQPPLRPPRPAIRPLHDRQRLHALRRPGVHDRLPDRRHPPQRQRRAGDHQRRDLHRLRCLR
jgi:CRP-like cAMP-binding protein